jgi:L-lactate dehydrogenase complex protein LldF
MRGIDSEIDRSLPYASSLCGACFEVCPVAIDIPEVLVHLRAKVAEQPSGHRVERAAMKVATYAMTHPAVYRAAETAAVRGRKLVPKKIPFGAGKAWTETRDLPELPPQTFRQWWKETHR